MKQLQQTEIIPVITNIRPADLLKDLPKYMAKIKSTEEIKIVYFGTPEFSAYILEKLVEFCQNPPPNLAVHLPGVRTNLPQKYIIQTIVTRPDKPVGRKQDLRSSPVNMVAQKHNIPVLKPIKLNNEFITSNLPLLTADLFIVASYGKIIPQAVLDIPKFGSLNVHGSILPKYRGASPIQSAILNGDKTTGVTIMLMDAEMDHGSIISTKQITILEQDNYQTLSKKMMQVSSPLLIETLVKFVNGNIKPRVQNHAIATYCNLLTKESGFFDIQNPPSSEVLDRMIRAYSPWPGVWTRWNGKIVKFLPLSSHPVLDTGSINIDSGFRQNDGFLIQMEGKKPLSQKDFLNGYPDFPFKKFFKDEI